MNRIRIAVGIVALHATACSGDKPKSSQQETPAPGKPTPAPSTSVQTPGDCTVAVADGVAVDGSSLWVDTPVVSNCAFHQLAWNNFLYLAGNDASGHPRFMSMAPWTQLFPASGTPRWTGTYTPLQPTELTRDEAGDTFSLVDVNQQTTAYDIRVDKTFFDHVVEEQLFTRARLYEQALAFNAAPSSKGIWLPGGDAQSGQTGAIETKTSWRSFGSDEAACPSDLMHCEKDASGVYWGLVGFHLVQKTPTHGEMIWASFEHVANAPDCSPGGSNPIQREPVDPTDRGRTINVNKNIPGQKDNSGWSYFDYATYTQAGGREATCAVADGAYDPATARCAAPSKTPLCNTDPQDGEGYKNVNVCRTDALPPPDQDCTVAQACNGYHVSWLNQSVQQNFPKGLDDKWRYYILIGGQWTALLNGDEVVRTQGAPQVGCFSYDDGAAGASNSGKATVYGFYCDTIQPGTYPKVQIEGTRDLANTTMETWMQKGMCAQYGAPSNRLFTGRDCFSCHQPETFGQPGKNFGQGDTSHVFTRIQQ